MKPVLLRDEGQGRPLFLVHASDGDVAAYVDLIRHLEPGRRIYGFRAAGLFPGEEMGERVETMAQTYLAAVREHQTSGPFYLAGWSMGSLIAYEMARLLEQQLETVNLLALIDTVFGSISFGDGSSVEKSDDDTLLRWMQTQSRRAGLEPVANTVEDLRRLEKLNSDHVAIVGDYRPGTYGGDALVLNARERQDDPTPTWRSVIAGRLVRETIPGDHFTVMREPHVRQMASHINLALIDAP